MSSIVDSSEVPLFGEQHIPVYLNVYDMLPRGKITDIGYRIGVGVFHSGVEILGREYNFGGHDYDFTGVFVMRPKIGPPNVTFKESIAMGYTTLDKEEIKNVIDELSIEWSGNSVVPNGWIEPPELDAGTNTTTQTSTITSTITTSTINGRSYEPRVISDTQALKG
ncbi:1121_t:CDS:2 [Funneliformis mosseae]|uniref:1121_t:CDS:1 n=1 Tax=Funneliformis mosseae TaxID=27381 RepID=A0A9N9BNJ3_FUNMO|nr:1121_t:CDS:2 [Funneliformis mosseae]